MAGVAWMVAQLRRPPLAGGHPALPGSLVGHWFQAPLDQDLLLASWQSPSSSAQCRQLDRSYSGRSAGISATVGAVVAPGAGLFAGNGVVATRPVGAGVPVGVGAGVTPVEDRTAASIVISPELMGASAVAFSLTVENEIAIEDRDEKALLARIAVLYLVVAAVNLTTRFERLRWPRPFTTPRPSPRT